MLEGTVQFNVDRLAVLQPIGRPAYRYESHPSPPEAVARNSVVWPTAMLV